jgi:SpoVK/Ycf46/Vps4 family AAA+-type ATPase
VLLFSGPPGTGKTLLARAVAHRLGRPLLRARADHLAEADGPVEEAIDALFQDASLHDAILFFDECEALFGQRGARLGTLLQAIEAFDGVLLLATNLPERLDPAVERRIVHRVDFELPAPAEREQIWEMHLPPEADIAPDVDIPLLSNLFNLSGGAIKNAVLAALSAAVDLDPERPTLDMALLRRAAEGQTRSKLEGLAERSRVNLRLADLVLPDEEHRKVAEIAAACRNKDLVQNRWGLGRRLTTGRGIAILFDGPPGTGKTLCAELLAAELGRPLYRVHIPNVVSKWVGETEKNISEIFARARSVQSVLLFDEADSLFSARTEVRSSNDRFANQEVNLLLQEIERSDGIVILTTNLFGGLDEALRRRIQYRVTFPMPGAAERARIWERLVPAETPLAADVNFERMGALYEFAGGAIKNAVVRASYRAWEDGGGLTQGHLIDAGRVECEALGIAVRTGLASVPRRSLDAAQAPVASAVGRGA